MELESKKSFINKFILSDNPTIEYPHFVISVLKMNKKKMNGVNLSDSFLKLNA